MQKKNPMLPLYVADALMFLAVFLIALPNIILKEPLEIGQTLALSFVVLIAMFMVLVPLLLNNRKQNDASALKFSQQIEQIFADLRTLRDSLMEQIKKIDIAGNEIENLDASIIKLEEDIENLNLSSSETAKLSDNLNELSSSLANLKTEVEKLANDQALDTINDDKINALEERIENLSEKAEEKFQIIDEICLHLQTLVNDEEEIDEDDEDDFDDDREEEVIDAEAEEKLPEESDGIDEDVFSDDEEEIEEQIQDENSEDDFETEVEEDLINYDENFENDDEEPLKKTTETDEEEVEEESLEKSETKGNPKWAGMLDKAFQNSQSSSTRETVSRFIEKNKQGDAPEESNGVEAPLEEADASDPVASMTIDELEKTETFKEVDEGVKVFEEKIAREDMLFADDEIPQAHKPTRLKNGDTAVVVNAFLGIGNIPYVRGNGAGLSQKKGTPMDLLEIGKYQWKCEGLISEPIKISIWLNDETPSTLGELTLNPNETLDIDPSF